MSVRRAVVVLVAAAVAVGAAAPVPATADPAPAVTAGAIADPEPRAPAPDDPAPAWARAVSMGGLLTAHAGVYLWTYFAWYRGRATRDHVALADEGWFGPETYAGGADKLGHGYSNYVFVRSAMGILEAGGWDRRTAAIVSSGLTALLFTVVEIKDGLHQGYGFSIGDMVFNLGGNALGVLLASWPRADEFVDLRLEYVPTDEFLDQLADQGVNVAEDYSGMTYQLVFHLGALRAVRERSRWLGLLDLNVGYATRGYLPIPDDPMQPREQRLYLGVSLNVQGLLRDHVWGAPRGPREVSGRRVVDAITEVYTLPYTTLPLVDAERARPPAMTGDARR